MQSQDGVAGPQGYDDAENGMDNGRVRLAEQRREKRLRRWDAVALLALVAAFLIIAWMLIIDTHFGMNTHPEQQLGYPPPARYNWSGQATLNSQTAQQAFASGLQLTPCVNVPGGTGVPYASPARSTTITWLFNSSSYGLARIQPICDPPAQSLNHLLWLFVMQRDLAESTHPWWTAGGAQVPLGRGPINQPPPTWLSLPADTYNEQSVGGPSYASVALLQGQTHFCLFGHITDQAIRPAGATSITVDGRAGWLMTENGLTTVTSVLPDDSTLFFSGTAAPATVQSLAAASFAHVDQALQPLG